MVHGAQPLFPGIETKIIEKVKQVPKLDNVKVFVFVAVVYDNLVCSIPYTSHYDYHVLSL